MDERRENAVLRDKIQELEFTSHALHVQQEVSLDGILVVDSNWNMVSYNQRFVDMWGIPPHILETKDDRATIQSILGKLKKPNRFLAKVEYLMAHPTKKSKEELELNDGQFFERYSAPIVNNKNLIEGRVWFFRDITEIKRSQKQLKQQNFHLEMHIQQRTSQLQAVNNALLKSQQECAVHQEELAHKNIGLTSLLHTLEEEKKLLEQKTTSTFRESLLPLFEMVKESPLSHSQLHLVETIEHILSNLSLSLTHSIRKNRLFFTPTELKIANFIKAGKTSKDIAHTLNVSTRTIEGHRLSIRKKFALKSGHNLNTFLQNLS